MEAPRRPPMRISTNLSPGPQSAASKIPALKPIAKAAAYNAGSATNEIQTLEIESHRIPPGTVSMRCGFGATLENSSRVGSTLKFAKTTAERAIGETV